MNFNKIYLISIFGLFICFVNAGRRGDSRSNNVLDEPGGDMEMLDWHCSLQSKDARTTICQHHLFKRGQVPKSKYHKDFGPINHLEFEDAKKIWCQMPEHKENSFCSLKLKKDSKGHFKTNINYVEVRGLLLWWCGDKTNANSKYCETVVAQVISVEEQRQQQQQQENNNEENNNEENNNEENNNEEKEKNHYNNEYLNLNVKNEIIHTKNKHSPNQLQKKIVNTFTNSMKNPNSEVHLILEKWCQGNMVDSNVCRTWNSFHHDHSMDL